MSYKRKPSYASDNYIVHTVTQIFGKTCSGGNASNMQCIQSGGRTWILVRGRRGSGRRPKINRIVISPIFIAEVVGDIPKRNLDNYLAVQNVIELM